MEIYHNCKYKFVMINIDNKTIDILIDKIWEARSLQVMRLICSLWYYNEVDFAELRLSVWWLNKFRAKLSKEWIIKKCKISDRWWYKWFLNPIYFNRGKVKEELRKEFESVNSKKIY